MNSIAPDELLARYILYSGWIRQSNQTVKQDAFVPPNNLELSVTRHINFTEDDIWNTGEKVAKYRKLPLYGRADIKTKHVKRQNLEVKPQPIKDNPNHAIIIGWPPEKNDRKMIALEIANTACFVSNPGKN